MNKTGVALLSALLTAGVGVGSLAIMNQIPATSNMLNTAFGGDKQIIKEEIKVESDFESTLNSKGLILVNYILEDGIVSDIIQKGSAVEFYKKPVKDGYACIGWSTTPDGKNMVANLNESCDLYPVFASGDFPVRIYFDYGYTTYQSVDQIRCTSLNTNGDGYSAGMAGISTSPDVIDLVSEIVPDGEYYAVYYFTSTGTMMSMNDARRYMDYMQYGEVGFKQATIHTILNGSITDEIRHLFTHESFSINHNHFFTEGFTNSPDSTEVLWTSNMEFEENGEYYMVYYGYVSGSGSQYFSHNQIKEMFDCIISSVDASGEAIKYDDLSTYETTCVIDGIEFRFVGWSTKYDSIDLIDNEDIIANDIKYVYAVYTREDTAEIYTTRQLQELRSDSVTRVYTYNTSNLFVHFIDKYEVDAVIGDVTYEFVGWSNMSSSTELIDGDWEDLKNADFIYGVYRDTTTDELLSRDEIYQIYRNNW